MPDAIVTAADSGLLPGMGGISATGEYQYRIPIDVPAGRAGVEPALALAYSSRGGNGHLGVGWQLDGLSEINRCAKTFATEGHADGVSFGGDDSFCLDGRKLIVVSGSYGGGESEYRTEEDIFARITLHRGAQDRIASFEVRTKDGRIRTYAPPEPLASYAVMNGMLRDPISWPIQEERDRSGNAIVYSYQRQGALDAYPLLHAGDFIEYYPSRIDYTRGPNDGPGTGPRSVRFEYEPRADTSVAYLHDVAFKTTLRLKSILLDAPNPTAPELVWRYDLSYEQSPGSGRSRLTAVQRCGVQHDGSVGGCLDAKKFTWNQDPHGPTYAKEAVWDDSLGEPALVGDFNGDGRAEVLSWDGTSVRYTLDPEHPLAEQCHPVGLVPGTNLADAKIADIYGDGRPRILASLGPSYFIIELVYTASTSGTGIGCELSYTSLLLGEVNNDEKRWPIHITDLDGDGLPDLIKGESTSNPEIWNWHYRLNSVQLDPQITWEFGPSHVAPFTEPPARDGFLSVSFSTDTGAHRGVIFPGMKYDPSTGAQLNNFYGFGLAADGTPFAKSTNDLSLNYFPDTNFAAFGDTNGDGVRNPVGYKFDKEVICLERVCEGVDLHDRKIDKPEEWHVETADLDSDGQDEVLLIHTSGEREVLLFRLNAQGGVEQSDAPFTAPAAIGDFNGDGLLDILIGDGNADPGNHTKAATVYRQTGSGTTDRIVAVNNAGDPGDTDLSARETIAYSNAQFTDMGTTCRYPQRCMRQGFTVVREHDVYQGPEVATSSQSVRRQLFNYEEPRFDVRGRGFLGFGIVRMWDADRAAETITTYDNATSDDNGLRLVYPGALKPKTVLRVVPMDDKARATSRSARLFKTTTTYELARLNQEQTYFVHPSAWESLEWEEEVDVDYGDSARIHISGIDGVSEKAALRQRKGSSHVDAYGNEIDAQVETIHGVRSGVVSTYTNDTVDWLIGQLKTTDVTTSEYGQPVPAPRHKDYDYDARGLLCHVYTEKDDPSPGIPQLVTFTHDSEGLLSAVTTSAIGKPLRTVHVAYEPTERVYPAETWNDLGQGSWSLHDPARGVVLAREDANGLQKHARYDDLGRLIQAVPEGAASLDLSYEPRTTASGAVIGMRVSTVSATGSTSRSDHDLLGRTVRRGHKGFDGGWIEEATVYDGLGRIVAQTRPDVGKPSKKATQITYDNLDRPLLKTLPGGGTVAYEHSFSTTMRSDTFTDRQTVRDLDGRVIHSVEDAKNTRLVTAFAYGAFNQLDHVTDPSGNEIKVHYDQRGRRTFVSDPDAGTTTFSYDGFGDEISRTVGGDQTVSEYDLLGRLTQTDHAGELTVTTWDTHGAGRVAHTVSPDGVEQDFTYTALGQLDALTYTIDGQNFEFKLGYDGLGRVVNVTYPKIGGQPQRFSVGQSYTPSGYLGSVYNPNAFLSTPYWRVDGRNAEDQLTHVTLGDGTVGIRNYEPEAGLLASISEGQSLALSYGYYPDGSLASRQDTLADRDETFTYDTFHRLASWNLQKSPEIGYRYDDLGNLTEIWSKATPWGASVLQEKNTYGSNGKPHALTQGPLGTYTYDARGRQDTAPTRSLVTYNERDLPRKITSSSGEETLFAYDASGARVKKQGPSGTVVTLGGLYERRTVAGHIQHIFYVTGGDEGPVARVVSEQGDALAKAKAAYLHHDPLLGSVVAVSGAGGALKEAFYYEPFGQRTDAQGKPLASAPSEVGSGFTGQEHDEDLGLINFRGRIYDPVLRRFLSADPHVTNPFSGQAYNRYSYVLNNPTNLIDPTGFDCIGQECSGFGTEYSSAGYESTYGNDYSGCFTQVDGATPVHAGGSGGVGWSTIGGINVGAPVQAVERQRQVSMPTGPSAPAGSISGPVVKADADADKWNPYSDKGRIHQALFGAEPPLQDPLEPYGPALGSIGVSFIPGLNSYMVLNDPEASTASKVLAVGSDVLSVVGVGTVLKLGTKGVVLGKGLVFGTKVAEGAIVAEEAALGSGRAYSVLFEMRMELPNAIGTGERRFHNLLANEALADAMSANAEFGASVRQLIPDIGISGRMTGSPGVGWTWHHAQETGVMQLVPTLQHTATGPIRELLHPFQAFGPTRTGGFNLWGHLF